LLIDVFFFYIYRHKSMRTIRTGLKSDEIYFNP